MINSTNIGKYNNNSFFLNKILNKLRIDRNVFNLIKNISSKNPIMVSDLVIKF